MSEPTKPNPRPPAYPGGRSPGELGTHQGGKLSPVHPSDGLHGDVPRELPPHYRGRRA